MTGGPHPYAPRLGALIEDGGVRFRVWAPDASRVAVRIEDGGSATDVPMQPEEAGYFTTHVPGIHAGARYRYVLDGAAAYPDPASRFQPHGVHGASAVVDPSMFAWHDEAWRGVDRDRVTRMELHVGTFTPEG
ncbi:MAG: malto-oligosyltrehalose trehalohydrolase, partial [Dehalococcoidia bacterium]